MTIKPGFIGPRPACRLCGGTAAMLRHRASRLDAHNLCTVRAARGEATPSLGDECPDCLGAGCHPRSAVGPMNPSKAALEKWAPTCKTCKGTGAV